MAVIVGACKIKLGGVVLGRRHFGIESAIEKSLTGVLRGMLQVQDNKRKPLNTRK